eukprot:TRINITY_DN68458_c0_g1_i1.p1 TRINITY_DN68458_c0_g1~~TRINITY_DN68458_c0_g1_i1.p1  ORF type:complete len:306 (+),score=26.02 TRINITY_DN68458_c0_g1_i1:67-984(+)
MASADRLFKIMLLGDEKTGKTALISRYLDNRIDPVYEPTLNVDFRHKTHQLEGKQIKIQIWDPTGNSSYSAQITNYLMKVHAVLICFDVTQPDALKNLTFWKTMADNYCSPAAVKVLVATKIDLVEERQATPEQCQEFAETWKLPLHETGAGTASAPGVQDLFHTITSQVQRLPDPLPPNPNIPVSNASMPSDPGAAGSIGLARLRTEQRSSTPMSFASETPSNAPLVDTEDSDEEGGGGLFSCCCGKKKPKRKPQAKPTPEEQEEEQGATEPEPEVEAEGEASSSMGLHPPEPPQSAEQAEVAT